MLIDTESHAAIVIGVDTEIDIDVNTVLYSLSYRQM